MASSNVNGVSSSHEEYRKRVMLGPLPADFLTVSSASSPAGGGRGGVNDSRQQQERNDHAMAQQLQMTNRTQPVVGRLQITVVRATLNKNYGMTRMDPYARLHFGQQVFETQTDANGAKNPVWNKTFYIYQLPKSYTSFHLEIYDERTLTDDERIAWVTIPLPQTGDVSDKGYKLCGKLGDDMEGTIHISMGYETGPAPCVPPMMMYGGYPGVTSYMTPMQGMYQGPVIQPQLPQPPPQLSQEEIKQVCSMFPDIEPDVVASVLEASNNNKEAAVEALLAMQTN
uniref:Toll-interacting protein-like isoform X2 n=2 Tax=Hirondellea gigas TaxID=1518452 RepID=A0A6A7FNB0_9CRUS